MTYGSPFTDEGRPRRASRLLATTTAGLAGLATLLSTAGAVATPGSGAASRLATRSAAAAPTSWVARFAAGATIKDPSGHRWSSDRSVAKGGTVWRSKTAIGGTVNDVLFQGERYGNFSYAIKVPTTGVYQVQLNETETTFTKAGQRVFTVAAEGRPTGSKIDIVKRTGGRYKPLTITFNATVTDGVLNLGFAGVRNNARVSSVKVTLAKATAPTSATTPTPGATAAPVIASPTTAPAPATATSSSIFGSPFSGDPTMPISGFFSSSSVFTMSLSSAPVASNSAALVGTLVSQVNSYYSGIAGFNVWQYNTSNYTVGGSQALVTLKYDDCQHKGYVPSSVYGVNGFMVNVPVPSNAAPSVGSDASIGIFQPSSDTYWGFWKLNKQSDGWHACWGGKIDHVSQSRGWYVNGEGVSATGLADGGSISIKEAQAGHIDHAIAVGIPSPADWHRFSWPALRSDGSDTGANAIPEGTKFRLDPSINVDALALSPLAKMVAKAAQKYGFIITDKAGCVSVSTESGAAVNDLTGVNPWNALLGSTPSYLVMKNFPWDKLQAMPQDYGKS